MPLLRRRHPRVEFIILGSHPPEELLRLADSEHIIVTGYVDDFRPYIWQATGSVAPIFTGTGMRVKLLEAMACGSPVVCTKLSINGFDAVEGTHYLGAETVQGFVEACSRCIRDPELAKSLGQAGRELVKTRHGWRAKAAERVAIWSQVLDSTPGMQT